MLPAPPPPCVPAGAQIVAERGAAAVYAQGRARLGCYRSGAPVELRAADDYSQLSRITLNGRCVAFARNGESVEVLDLRAGRRLERHPAVRWPAHGLPTSDAVNSLRLRGDGAVAWVATRVILPVSSATAPPPTGFPRAREARGARHGHDRLLQRSNDIRAGSLRLQGRFVLWRAGAVQRKELL